MRGLGLERRGEGPRVAVLAVEPTSPVSGGSILGDKTRMQALSRNPAAFIRPSPSGTALGGVAQSTREAMLLCEAAGYDVVIVETVGIGQSQVAVAGMVDFFLLMLLPGGGDELQGIKKGVVELADCLRVNKADGPTAELAERTRAEAARARQGIRWLGSTWPPPVPAGGHRGSGPAHGPVTGWRRAGGPCWPTAKSLRTAENSNAGADDRRETGCGACSRTACKPRFAAIQKSRARSRRSRRRSKPGRPLQMRPPETCWSAS